MRRWLWVVLVCMAGGAAVAAQSDDVLTVDDVAVTTQQSAFGVPEEVASGMLENTSEDDAFADVQVFAELYDADGEIVGEGVGFLVNQCGQSVPVDFVLQPGDAQRFVATLELYEVDGTYEDVEFFPQGRATEPAATADADPVDGVIPVTGREIAGLEWATETVEGDDEDAEPEMRQTLLYGVGCYRDVFTTYDWYEYDPTEDSTQAIQHPRYEMATDPAVRERLELTDDTLYNRSQLTYPPNTDGGRLVHQTDINTLITAEPDGTFRRVIDDELFRSTLQGVNWLPDERFLAYYYGAYGDGVTYLVASAAGAYFSTPERFSVPSVTVPGVTPDISRLIVSGTFNDDARPGFYLKPPAAEQFERLFAWDNLPGNNYPAPVYRSFGGVQGEDVIYFALLNSDDEPGLYCYDRADERLYNLAPLPLELGTEDRAFMRLSPDGEQIALGANGVNGGLWLLDLSEFDECNRE